MYSKQSHLTRLPFRLRPDPEFLFDAAEQGRIKTLLETKLLDAGCSVLLTGDPGVGKTTFVGHLLMNLPAGISVVKINQPRLSATELLQAVLAQMGVEISESNREGMRRKFEHHLAHRARLRNKTLVIVDDGQLMGEATLEQAFYMAAVNARHSYAMPLLLCGRPDLRARIDGFHDTRMTQYVDTRLAMTPLSASEVEPYIHHRLAKGGALDYLAFDAEAFATIHRYTGGVPRRINILCDATLMDAELDNGNRITAAIVHDTLRKLGWPKYSAADDRDPQITKIEPGARESTDCAQLMAMLKSVVVARLDLQPGSVNIGRAPGNELLLNDQAVSRRHCRITTTSSGSIIEDLNSINGLYVNARRVISLPLADRDVVQIGNHTLVYRSRLG